MTEVCIWWIRRDLRLHDNTALHHALESGYPVLPLFVFDTAILDQLPSPDDRRLTFIHERLNELREKLQKLGSSLRIYHGLPIDALEELRLTYTLKGVYTNGDYEPYAHQRDKTILNHLSEHVIPFNLYKDQVIFHKNDILKQDGRPYTVYTPYSKAWKAMLQQQPVNVLPDHSGSRNFFQTKPLPFPTLEEIGFNRTDTLIPPLQLNEELIRNYHKTRNNPGIEGTSHAGIHLRFGTVSIRELVLLASAWSQTWLNELIWREFFMMILYHFPRVVHSNFRTKYDELEWRNDEADFERWCKGETGYPIVDAGMRQLNETGYMHNRVRMVTAGFLTKHLLIDWRWGEAYFASKLLDYELSSNNGNWQWVAGTGCDAAPYFRIFNPETQQQKFDPQFTYIKRWIRNFTPDYLPPMIEHREARSRALAVFGKVNG